MKVLPFQIPKPEHDALIYQEDKEVVFYDKFHQHKEIQVSFIAAGEGTLIVGDTINYYKKGDVLAIGSNLPHVFKSDVANDKIINPDYLENKFITDDGLSLGYYVSAKKIGWYLVLDKYGSDNTIFIKDPSLLKTAFNTAKQKIEELKI